MNKKPVFIIAEAGVNHNGSVEMAKKLIDCAAQAGADAVKFQTFKTETLVSKKALKAEYQQKATDIHESQYDMLKKLELSENMHDTLVEYCRQCGIQFLSTPFDEASLNLLVEKYNMSYIKISSGEITNAPFLLEIARKGTPVILSTGMSTLGEVEQALGVLAFGYTAKLSDKPSVSTFCEAYISPVGQQTLQRNVTLLHCTTEYPTPCNEVNLRVIETLKNAFGLQVGYSDHTQGVGVPIAAVALGAVVIEKHFTLNRELPGPDHKASLEPHELKEMVTGIRQIEEAMGDPRKMPTVSELKNKQIARKSLIAIRDIKKGEVFTADNLGIKRPGDGISPLRYWEWLGKVAEQNYRVDEKILP